MKSISGNQRGGARPGAGRPKGSANKRTREIADALAESGAETPLEFLLRVMRNSPDEAKALEAAKAAAPYCHPRLNSVEVSNPDGESFKHEFTWAG